MPVLQFKGKTAVECYHYTVPHHTLDFDRKLSGDLLVLGHVVTALQTIGNSFFLRLFCPSSRFELPYLPDLLSPARVSGFNVETVEYKNISFTVWDVGG